MHSWHCMSMHVTNYVTPTMSSLTIQGRHLLRLFHVYNAGPVTADSGTLGDAQGCHVFLFSIFDFINNHVYSRGCTPEFPAKLQSHHNGKLSTTMHATLTPTHYHRSRPTRRAWPEKRPCYRRRVYMLLHRVCRR